MLLAGGVSAVAHSAIEAFEDGLLALETEGDAVGAIRHFERALQDPRLEPGERAETLYRLGASRLLAGDAAGAGETWGRLRREFGAANPWAALAALHPAGVGDPRFSPADWHHGRHDIYRILVGQGEELGYFLIHWMLPDPQEAENWRVTTITSLGWGSSRRISQTDSLINRETMLPSRISSHSILGEFEILATDAGTAELRRAGTEEVQTQFASETPLYDFASHYYMLERLPLAEDYRAGFSMLATMFMLPLEVRLRTEGRETLAWRDRSVDTWRVRMEFQHGGQQMMNGVYWVETEPPNRLIRSDQGTMLIELAEQRTLPPHRPSQLTFHQGRLGFTLPAGHAWVRREPRGRFDEAHDIISLDGRVFATLAVGKMDEQENSSPGAIVDEDLVVLERSLRNYTKRPDSRREVRQGRWTRIDLRGDYEDDGVPRTEARVYWVADRTVVLFVMVGERKAGNRINETFESILGSFGEADERGEG